jgi:hypothetical protein
LWEAFFFVGVRRFLGRRFLVRRKVFPAVGYLQFPFLRRKRYSIPAQNGVTEASERIGQRFPAQAVTISLSAQKKIPHSGAERCHESFRAYWAAISRADGYNLTAPQKLDTNILVMKNVKWSSEFSDGHYFSSKNFYYICSLTDKKIT